MHLPILLVICSCLILLSSATSGLPGGELPPYWTKNVWKGREYYYNTLTGKSQWENPVDTNPVPKKTDYQPISRPKKQHLYAQHRKSSKPYSTSQTQEPSLSFENISAVEINSQHDNNVSIQHNGECLFFITFQS